MKTVITLTDSQRMALCSILTEHMMLSEMVATSAYAAQEFVDCSTVPPTTTTAGDLLVLVLNAPAESDGRPRCRLCGADVECEHMGGLK